MRFKGVRNVSAVPFDLKDPLFEIKMMQKVGGSFTVLFVLLVLFVHFLR